MTLAQWSLGIGGILVSMVLVGTFLRRTPMTAAILYLVAGFLLGPAVLGVFQPDPLSNAQTLRVVAEAGLLIALFAVGLRLGVPLRGRRWWLPLRLASASMLAMVGMITAVGVLLLGLSPGAAVLLGAILAPTDPVLASGLPSEAGARPDRIGFSLAAEGGLNDGTAFPFVMLGLGLLGMHDMGDSMWRWWLVDVLWSTFAGLAIGALSGAAIGRVVVHLRSRHREALGSDEFLSLGLVALAYGAAQLVLASGFLAVFAAGLALQRVREPAGSADGAASRSRRSTMLDSVQAFNAQLEKLAELALIIVAGAVVWYAPLLPAVWWFVPLVLLLMRPLSVTLAFTGARLERSQMTMLGWFGIRGVGSLFYLFLVMEHGIVGPEQQLLLSLTVYTVVASIVLHGLTSRLMMTRYIRHRTNRGLRAPGHSA